MVNKSILLFVACFVALGVFSCGENKHKHESDSSVQDAETWKEMDDFHLIMADVFHPYMDSANLQPAKQHASAMAKAASEWAESPLPEKMDNAATRNKLSLLNQGCQEFVNIAQSEDSVEIGTSLTALHDLFHEIQEKWYGHDHGGHDHDHDHH
ncbi:MAG TPA: hypothetical protein VD884_17675 [Ohtaekwangia sp.]|nr:hypothetical protein [Ohtaekwangia sp.]